MTCSVLTCFQDSLKMVCTIPTTYCQQRYCEGQVWLTLTLSVDYHASESRTHMNLGSAATICGSERQAAQRELSYIFLGQQI